MRYLAFPPTFRSRSTWLSLAAALPFTVLAACECSGDVGERRDGGAPDAATPGRVELCGNGLDDDRNGRVDDGCPCGPGETQTCASGSVAQAGVGACRAGSQLCDVPSGTEWGDWGDYACTGAIAPTDELCNDVDDDCDGAIDEACPCTDGATRACSEEFTTAPCSAGTQTCRAGTWSSCEGAVLPTSEICGNAIDDDCDGAADPDRLCRCVPVPEVCGNAIDDDCDGATDEVACIAAPDAGVSDAGTSDASVEPPSCTQPETLTCLAQVATIDLGDVGLRDSSGHFAEGPSVVGGHGDELAFIGVGHFVRVSRTELVSNAAFDFPHWSAVAGVRLFDTGRDYILVWTPDNESGQLQRVSYEGGPIGAAVALSTSATSVAYASLADGIVTVAYREITITPGGVWGSTVEYEDFFVRRFDTGLNPVGGAELLDLSSLPADSTPVVATEVAAVDGSRFLAAFARTYTAPTGDVYSWDRPIVGSFVSAALGATFDPGDTVGTNIDFPMAASCGRVLGWWAYATGETEPFPSGGTRSYTSSARVVLGPDATVIAPTVHPLPDRFGGNDPIVMSLGAQGWAVLEQSDAVVAPSRTDEWGVLVRLALDGTVLQTLALPRENYSNSFIPTATVVGECVAVVRTTTQYDDGTQTPHIRVSWFCPADC